MSSKSIVLRKSGGFYQAFDDDALIINYLFDYKINNHKCGFPLKTLDKVINILEEKSISYIIKNKEEIIKDFKKKNNYNKYLDKSKTKYNIKNIHKLILIALLLFSILVLINPPTYKNKQLPPSKNNLPISDNIKLGIISAQA